MLLFNDFLETSVILIALAFQNQISVTISEHLNVTVCISKLRG